MLTQTLGRLPGLVSPENTFVLTNREQVDADRELCSSLPPENVEAEPEARDTAPEVGLATLKVKRRCSGASLAMLPADHVIRDAKGFRAVLESAFLAAERDSVLVTVGIVPTEPATGYGYIEKGDSLGELNGHPLFSVRRFVEKPDLETARKYVDSGGFFWNGGMFVWQVATIEKAFEEHATELWKGLAVLEADLIGGEEFEIALSRNFPALPKISVDFAVMEKARNVVTVSADFDWDDVGSWPAAARHMNPMGNGNVSRGRALIENGSGNIIVSGKDHLVAVVGCDNLVVVHTDDASLVCPKNEAQKIKALVKRLGANEADRHLL
jgi:mannose-1-phosphate guanylyltransferase